ncbi:hypothetical protein TURU_133413 [Turdus rufiventris]|nr:hypothetical protein TURU_133413 [Turdus rufiventris]
MLGTTEKNLAQPLTPPFTQTGIEKIPSQASLVEADRPSSLSLSSRDSAVPDQRWSPPLQLLQELRVSPELRSPQLGTALQVKAPCPPPWNGQGWGKDKAERLQKTDKTFRISPLEM